MNFTSLAIGYIAETSQKTISVHLPSHGKWLWIAPTPLPHPHHPSYLSAYISDLMMNTCTQSVIAKEAHFLPCVSPAQWRVHNA